jgi:predicted PurR-regulated permease PerM
MSQYPPLVRYLIGLLFAFAVIAALIIVKTLLVPLFWAILLAYLLYPLASRLEKSHVPRILTNFMVIIGAIVVIAAFGYVISLLIGHFTNSLPNLKENFVQNISQLRGAIKNLFGISSKQLEQIINNAFSTVEFMGAFFTTTKNTLLAIGLIPVYTFLLLFYRNKFRNFISMLVQPEQEETVEKIANQAAHIVPRYLKGIFIVCIIMFGLNTLGYYILGVKFAVLMGIIAAIFSLIPYIGNIIGYGIVAIFVIAIQSPALAVGVVVQFAIVQFIENNILTPNITGSYVEINPLVIIFSLIAGGMIWGLPGLFMVIPYLAMLKIVCENVPGLKPIGFLLSTRGTERHTISIDSLKSFFGWNNHSKRKDKREEDIEREKEKEGEGI